MRYMLTVVSVFLLSGCATSHLKDKRIVKDAFPEDFKDKKLILLVQKVSGGLTAGTYNRRIDRSLQNDFTGRYVMVTKNEILNDSRYADKSIYKYVVTKEVMVNRGPKTITKNSNGAVTDIQYNTAYRLDFHIYDRVIDKNYPDMGCSSNSFPKAIKRLGPVLNKKYTE